MCMKIEPEIQKYLKGEEFKNNLTFNISRKKQVSISRELAILKLIEGKKVVHIGCSDHIQIIREKIKNNIWLHKLITEKASKCIGIDIDEASIRFIRNELKYENVFNADITGEKLKEITDDKWDYAVFGEMVEHLDNPVNFLKAFREKYKENVNNFIITVPNIYNVSQLRKMKNYQEIINSDHRFWFTPYTILKVLFSAGYKPDEIIFSNRQSLSISQLTLRKIRQFLGLKEMYPFYYFKTLIISGSLN